MKRRRDEHTPRTTPRRPRKKRSTFQLVKQLWKPENKLKFLNSFDRAADSIPLTLDADASTHLILFYIEVCIEKLTEIPLVLPDVFAQVRYVQRGKRRPVSQRTSSQPVDSRTHEVQWNDRIVIDKLYVAVDDATLTLRQRYVECAVFFYPIGARKVQQLGRAKIDIAPFAGRRLGTATRRSFLLYQCDINCVLTVSLCMRQISGDRLFRVPEFPTLNSDVADRVAENRKRRASASRKKRGGGGEGSGSRRDRLAGTGGITPLSGSESGPGAAGSHFLTPGEYADRDRGMDSEGEDTASLEVDVRDDEDEVSASDRDREGEEEGEVAKRRHGHSHSHKHTRERSKDMDDIIVEVGAVGAFSHQHWQVPVLEVDASNFVDDLLDAHTPASLPSSGEVEGEEGDAGAGAGAGEDEDSASEDGIFFRDSLVLLGSSMSLRGSLRPSLSDPDGEMVRMIDDILVNYSELVPDLSGDEEEEGENEEDDDGAVVVQL